MLPTLEFSTTGFNNEPLTQITFNYRSFSKVEDFDNMIADLKVAKASFKDMKDSLSAICVNCGATKGHHTLFKNNGATLLVCKKESPTSIISIFTKES